MAPIASVAKRALSANTALLRDSKRTSCRTLYHPPARMMGIEVPITTSANLQWNITAMVVQPIKPKIDIMTIAMFVPRSCWSCAGSVAMRAVRRPMELSASSKKDMRLQMMLRKYSLR